MKRDLAIIGVTLALLVLQGALLGHQTTRADFGTLAVVYLALERAVISGAVVALVVGYLADIFAGTDRGLYASTAVIVFFIVRLLVSQFAGGGLVFVTLTSVLATLGALLISFGVENLVGLGQVDFAALSVTFGPMLIVAAALGYPCYRLFHALDDKLGEADDDMLMRGGH